MKNIGLNWLLVRLSTDNILQENSDLIDGTTKIPSILWQPLENIGSESSGVHKSIVIYLSEGRIYHGGNTVYSC